MRRTKATAPRSTTSIGRTSPTICSWRRNDLDPDPGVRSRITFGLASRDRVHVRTRLLDRNAGLQARDNVDEIRVARFAFSRIKGDRHQTCVRVLGNAKPAGMTPTTM